MIDVDDLGKMYRLRQQYGTAYPSFREVITATVSGQIEQMKMGLSRSRRSLSASGVATSFRSTSVMEEFWALRNVSFEIGKGEVVGVVGRNGAGKSTLLKLLSRITEPTEGRIHLRGRVASLLEVGTGFHPELTGRENIYLNGAILGMSRREVLDRFDEIVAFAEVERFLETPVKRYSSGMYVRLAFAIAAHLEPEILIVDEVLAVGDAQFQKKCLGRMDAVAQSGRTVLFVSHNMATIQRLCARGLFLEGGLLKEDGPISTIISRYNSTEHSAGIGKFDSRERKGSGWARVTDIRIVGSESDLNRAPASDEALIIDVDIAVTKNAGAGMTLKGLIVELMFFNQHGQPLTSVMNLDEPRLELPERQACTVRMTLPGPTFIQGTYHLNVFLGIPFLQQVDEIVQAVTFEILPPINSWRPYDLHEMRGYMCRKAEWSYPEGDAWSTPGQTSLLR